MIAWDQVFKLPWRARDAQIEAAIRFVLKDREDVLTTTELVMALSPIDESHRQDLMGRLGTMAPHLAPLARHDGEEFVRFGRKMRRWNWYGQKGKANDNSKSDTTTSV